MCNISLKITHKISLENIYKILIIVKLKNVDTENFYFPNFFIKYRVYPKIKSSNNRRIKINKKNLSFIRRKRGTNFEIKAVIH